MEAIDERIKKFLAIGSGSGSGYGSGDGSGDGDGDGIKSFNGQKVYYIDGVPTLIDNVGSNIAKGGILQTDFSIKPCYVVKCGNYFAHGATAHKAFEDAQNKAFKEYPEEERIRLFKQEYSDYDKKIPAMELFVWHNRLTGSCEMGRKSFAAQRGIDLDKDEFTVNEFIRLTENAYRGEIIKKLR